MASEKCFKLQNGVCDGKISTDAEVPAMNESNLEDVQATFARVVDEAAAGLPTIVTRDGERQAVIIGYSDYERLSRMPSLGWLLTNSHLEGEYLPANTRKPARALRDPAF